ncbi:MAG TPA: DNA translocase FtsK 4TM domain-containing protein, partial [Ideonella sp.]|nr:DNA translocase FtsK 4TM domain-containing protein [Ideonella sp.]
MTFPLGSLGAESAAAGPVKFERATRRAAPARAPAVAAPPRWRSQLLLVATGVLWLLALLALLSHQAGDSAWTTSGSGGTPRNWVGVLGARFSDVALFVFGYSCWWLVLVAARSWLGALARLLRTEGEPAAAPHAAHPPWLFWLGLALLLAASSSLEYTRLYQFDPHVPGGRAGGVLGYALGPLSMHLLGFAGSGVLWIASLVVGTSLALGFSWLQVAERLGARIESLRERRQERIDRALDLRLGEQALREREKGVEEERQVAIDHGPIVIEPTVVELPKSERVAKERQKPLFTELADTRLPQVDLLDAAPARVESVTSESLEMTSRLIEKKLKDFGVEVRVVAASPGPVITRYEVEPATGVKGAQIVNLAKDLARSLSLVSIRVVETIPGKTTMALELPNAKRQTIRLAEILGSQVYNDAHSQLTMGLGKDIVGN